MTDCIYVSDVIHTVGPQDGNGNHLESCYKTCLRLLTKHHLRSVVSDLLEEQNCKSLFAIQFLITYYTMSLKSLYHYNESINHNSETTLTRNRCFTTLKLLFTFSAPQHVQHINSVHSFNYPSVQRNKILNKGLACTILDYPQRK